jgi:hypothetical protein
MSSMSRLCDLRRPRRVGRVALARSGEISQSALTRDPWPGIQLGRAPNSAEQWDLLP